MQSELENAVKLHREGDIENALAIYKKLLQEYPDNPDIPHLIGLAYLQKREYTSAEKHLLKAIELSPGNTGFLFDYANLLASQEKFREAGECFDRIIKQDPGNERAFFSLGDIMRKTGDYKAASEFFGNAVRIKPGFFAAHLNRGLALRETGDMEQALGCFIRAVELEPGSFSANRILGITLNDLDKTSDALKQLRNAAVLQPKNPDIWYDLGNVLRTTKNSTEAIECFNRALELDPENIKAASNLGELYHSTGNIREALRIFENLFLKYPDNNIVCSNLLFVMNYDQACSNQDIFKKHHDWGNKFAADPLYIRNRRDNNKTRRPLRVGYVSPDFREHSVAWFIEPVLKRHNRDEFHICCYSNAAKPDDKTEHLRLLSDTWRNILNVDDLKASRLIASDDIDILVDLAGHTADNRLGIFALKPAPIQVTWLGYPNTTGLRTVDYRITDRLADPEGCDRFYSEELFRLPGCFLCYEPPEDLPGIGALHAMSNGTITFGSFNNIAKISGETVSAWSKILLSTPGSKLVLKNFHLDDPAVASDLLSRFLANGIPKDRIRLIGKKGSTFEHLDTYNSIDIALDTFPYNGTTTTCEALIMGVPVVVLNGGRHAGRVGTSLMTAAGCGTFINHSIGQYIDCAVTLAKKIRRLSDIRSSLRQQTVSSALCNQDIFIGNLERAFLEMWRRYCFSSGQGGKKKDG